MGDLRKIIEEHRAAIRAHRDARGDERCWLDDYFVWGRVEGSPGIPTQPPPFEDAMAACRAYYRFRNADAADPGPPGAVADPARWDEDLSAMDEHALAAEQARIEEVIRRHRDITGRERATDDDRALYAVLPEKISADFRLPKEDEFLGEALAPGAGCPSFWRSHASCPAACHDLHKWGPCRAICKSA